MWVRLDDAILDNPKIIAAGPLGFALHVAAITWCARNLTDGFIPKRRVAQLLELASLQVRETTKVRVLHALTAADVAADLAEIGLWHDRGAQWEVHDYLVYNPSRAQVLAKRERHAGRQDRYRSKQRDAPRDASSDASRDAPRDASSDASRDAPVTPPPVPVPVPVLDLSLATLARSPAPGFDEFWQRYPRHAGKQAARKAWAKLGPSPPLGAIVDALAWQRQLPGWQEERGRYVPHPATYLNGRRWEDERPAPGAIERLNAELGDT